MKIAHPTFTEELTFWKNGIEFVIGLDEVGRGSFAGPVVVAGVVFPKFFNITNELSLVHDSKLLSADKREKLVSPITKHSLYFDICEISVEIINNLGIGKATNIAFQKTIETIKNKLPNDSFFALVDGLKVKYEKDLFVKQKAIIKGDQKSFSIAAASIIAKVYRDKLMCDFHKTYPQYGFFENKGYGTKSHRDAIKKYGICSIHRTSFNLVG